MKSLSTSGTNEVSGGFTTNPTEALAARTNEVSGGFTTNPTEALAARTNEVSGGFTTNPTEALAAGTNEVSGGFASTPLPRRLLPIVLTWLVACLVTTHQGAGAEVSDADIKKLTVVEKNLFFKTYESQKTEDRVARLERRFFGEASTGELETRLTKILEVAGPQLTRPAPVPTPVPKERPANTSPSSQAPPVTKFDDPDRVDEKKRLAVLQARHKEIEILLKEGIKAWKRKKAALALSKFEQVLRLDSNNAEAHFSRGVIFEAQGKFSEASRSYNQAHDINPDNMEYKDAIQVLKGKLSKQANVDKKVADLRRRASNAFKRKEYISALDLYKQLEKKFPNKAIYKYNIGTIYVLMHSHEQALEYYEKALKLAPNVPQYQRGYEKVAAFVKESQAKRRKSNQEWDRYEAAMKARGSNRGQMQPPNTMPPTGAQPVGFQPQQRPPVRTGGGMQPPSHPTPGMQPPGNVLNSFGLIAQRGPKGVMVTTIGIGSRAASAGIKKGDIIVAADSISIESVDQLISVLLRKRPGEKVPLIINRMGRVGQILL